MKRLIINDSAETIINISGLQWDSTLRKWLNIHITSDRINRPELLLKANEVYILSVDALQYIKIKSIQIDNTQINITPLYCTHILDL